MRISPGEMIWFVHPNYDPPLPLQLRRTDGLGAEVVGGKTGSHCTGHGETYWDKLVELINLGYVPADVAKEIGTLDRNWAPPLVEELDKSIKDGDYSFRA